MKKLLLLAAIISALSANAQNYQITFAGTGLSTVKVENVTKGVSTVVTAGDMLNLSPATGVYDIENQRNNGLKIYPNPMDEKSTFEILPATAGDAVISVCENSGRLVAQVKTHLEKTSSKFSISGLKAGLYIISVKSGNYQFSGKLLSSGYSTGKIIIEKASDNKISADKKMPDDNSKGVQVNTDLQYSPGDILKYTGISGNNSTVITDIPTGDKTITFAFYACTDGSANNYPVVNINGKIWMAENLKTTKYASGVNILLVNTVQGWYDNVLATTKAYCWYNDNIVNKDTYGALYTWAAAMNGAASSAANPSGVQGVCPTGWHLPSNAEWTALTTYLGGESVAGGKLKETGTSHWITPNTGADNSSGFTALPGGNRKMLGEFEFFGNNAGWWSSTEQLTNYAYRRLVFYNSTDVNSTTSNYKSYAYSVRCVKN
jgi:uncharacterized protein (TIGR02145 family)